MGELMVAQRAMGAVIGSLVADAAGQPLHWIYDVKRLDQILKGREGTPEFVDPSQCPYYHQPTGAQSSYGDQTLALLKALVEGKGFDVELYRQQLYKTFGPNTDYDLKAKPKGKDSVPTGGYRHASIKAFLTAYEATKERTGLSPDPQMDGVTKVAPLVALYAGDPKLPQLVEQVVRVTQDDNLAVECSIAAATVLERLVLLPPEDGFLEKMKDQPELSVVSRQLPEVLKLRGTSHREVVQKFGSSCALPGNLLNSLHCLVIPPLTDYSTTVRRTMVAGGCNCSRLCFVGACAGAALGPSGIPADWVKKTTQGEAIKKLSEQLVALRQPE